MRRYIYIIILTSFFAMRAAGQVVVQFVPEIYGRTTEGLFNCRITNPYQKQSATLTITVSERHQGTVFIIKTPQFTIASGTNPIPVNVARSSSLQFSNNKIGSLISVNHLLPEGDYDYCFSITYVHSDNPPDEQCFSYVLAPFADLNLIDPYDKDKVCEKRPLFTWQPLIPAIMGSYYQLVLTEVKTGQNPTEALSYNMPIINQSNIVSPVLPYPPTARDLVAKKTYAWQITAYKDQTVLNRSDVWSFTVDCQDSVKKVVNDDGYRDIEDLAQGNYYIAEGKVKFALVNSYKPQNLKYEITSIDAPDKAIKRLPKLKLITGSNLLTIDLTESSALANGKYYILKVWLPDGTIKVLRFLFEDAK